MANESREERLKTQMGSSLFYADPSISQFEMHHTFEPGAELFNMHSGMEIFGSPAWKNQLPHQRDRSYVPWKAASSSSSRNAPESMNGYYPSEFQKPDFSSEFPEIAPESTWQENRLLVEDPSLRCVFPSEQPSQGLSLSLCPNGLQSHQQVSSREGFLGAKGSGFQYVHETPPSFTSSSGAYHLLRDSKYLVSAQELLSEFCNLGIKQKGDTSPEMKPHKSSQWEEGVSSRNQSLCSLDLIELQKRKGKLLSMLEEVDRRYRQYCEQMRGVVSMFEGVAGHGAAAIYLNSASKAMSRHFRCLRDGIVGQIKATKKAMGEKDPIAPGTTRGETPRLKVLDQALRQQRAFQQMGVLESHPWRPQRGLPERSVSVLRAWLFEHFLHPYPTDVDKHILARQTGLSRSQVSNWFINARVRLWKPMVEEMYLEEAKEQESKDQDGISGLLDSGRQDSGENPNPSSSHVPMDDQKPTITCHDSDSLSSIINNPERNQAGVLDRGSIHKHQQQQQQEFTRLESFGVVDLDFSSYSHGTSGVTYAGGGDASLHNFASSAGAQGVSLTLGLQQQGGTGVGLTFSPSGPQHSMYFTRQHMEDCQPIQYSILDGETQNLPYRNLMGAQLLHDLAG